MKAHLIQIDATDAAGAPASLYLASVDDAACCHLNEQQWIPSISRLPALRYDFFGGAFSGQIASPSAQFGVSIDGLPSFTGLRFSRARFRLWTGELGEAWGSYTQRFDGRITAEPEIENGEARFSAGPDDAWLDKPLLSLYTGDGGAEGPDDLEGQPKPLILGNCRFVPGTLVDAIDNVWQVSAYGAVQAVNTVYDRVNRLGGPVADYPSFAALVAASIPNGSTATCRALGLVRLGAPPDGQLTFDVAGDNAGAGGYVRRPGALIRRIAEIAGGTVDAGNLAAFDTARPYNQTLVLTEQTTARAEIQRIADANCAVAGITWTGALFVQPLGFTSPALTLASDGSALPPVEDVAVQAIAAPFWRLATEAEISWVEHSADQVATQFVLRGAYDPDRVYRLDDLVSLEDGSAWVYINSTPSAGNAPPVWPATSNEWWLNVDYPTSVTWENIGDPNGTKPDDNATNGANPVQTEAIFTPSVTINNPAQPLWAYENGLVLSFDKAQGRLQVWSGGVDVTAASTLSATGANCTGTINTANNAPVAGQPKGFYRVTDMPLGTDAGTLTLTATYGSYAPVVAVFNVTKMRGGYEIVDELPTTNLFPDRKVSYNGGLWVNKTGTVGDWTPLVDATNVGFGGNRLAGVIPASNPNRWCVLDNPDGRAYLDGGLGPVLSPAFGANWAGPDWTLPDNSTFALSEGAPNLSGHGYSDLFLTHANTVSGGTTRQWSVEGGKTYEFSFYSGAHQCRVDAVMAFRDPAGNWIEHHIDTNDGEKAGGKYLQDYKRSVVRGTAPDAAVSAVLGLRKWYTKPGWPGSWMFAAYPMFGETAEDPVGPLPWNMPGHSIFNAELIVSQSIVTNHLAAAAVTAAKMNVTQLSAITAIIGTLRTATTGARMEISDNVQKVYDTSNVKRMQTGDLSL